MKYSLTLFVFFSLMTVGASEEAFNNIPAYNAKSKSSKSGTAGGKSSKKNNIKKAPTEPKPSGLTCQSLHKKHCKMDVLCQWNKHAKMCLPRYDPVPNICLNNPEDIYRTCFQRSINPSNDLTEDAILRDKYNLGALMHQNGQESSVSTLSYITPYMPPYITSNELLTYGSMYLSMVTSEAVSNVTCNDKIELEEVSLE